MCQIKKYIVNHMVGCYLAVSARGKWQENRHDRQHRIAAGAGLDITSCFIKPFCMRTECKLIRQRQRWPVSPTR